MSKNLRFIFIIYLLVLFGCVPANKAAVFHPALTTVSTLQETPTLKAAVTEIHQNGAQSTPTKTEGMRKPIQGDVYISFRPVIPPFLLALGRLPADCLLTPASCPPVEILYQDRNQKQPVLRQTELIFSPDGNLIWWNNDYQQKIFALDAAAKTIQPVAQNILAIRDDFQWSPDGKWVALAAQGNGPYDGQVMLIDSKMGVRQILLNTPNELKIPVGWINNYELFVIILHYGPPADDPHGKWVENDPRLVVLNIASGQSRQYLKEFLGVDPRSLSPDRQWLAYYQNVDGMPNLYLQSLSEDKKFDLKTDQELVGWSPDSQWIALRSSQGDVYVLHPDGSTHHKVASFPGRTVSMRWFMDSQHLLIQENSTDQNGLDRTAFSLISMDDGSVYPIDLSGYNKDNFLMDNIYWAGN
jgi:hypothetical protein